MWKVSLNGNILLDRHSVSLLYFFKVHITSTTPYLHIVSYYSNVGFSCTLIIPIIDVNLSISLVANSSELLFLQFSPTDNNFLVLFTLRYVHKMGFYFVSIGKVKRLGVNFLRLRKYCIVHSVAISLKLIPISI